MGQAYTCDVCGKLIGYSSSRTEVQPVGVRRASVCITNNSAIEDTRLVDLCKNCTIERLEEAITLIKLETED